jgi:two-component system cell cycle response regulator
MRAHHVIGESPEREATIGDKGLAGGYWLWTNDWSLPTDGCIPVRHQKVDIEVDPSVSRLVPRCRGQLRPADHTVLTVSMAELCSQIRSLERTRNLPILAIADVETDTKLVRGLEIGVKLSTGVRCAN